MTRTSDSAPDTSSGSGRPPEHLPAEAAWRHPGRPGGLGRRAGLAAIAAFALGVAVGGLPGAPARLFPAPDQSARTAARGGIVATRGGEEARSEPAEAAARGRGSAAPEPEGFEIFWEALEIVQREYVDESALSGPGLAQGAVRGMVEALGDTGHTVYLTPEDVQAERDALQGRLTGIGVIVDDRAGLPLVVSVIDGSPADRAGLRSGDLIVSVDGVDVQRMADGELIRRVRGPAGTTLRLGVERRDRTGVVEFEIVREEIVVPAVAWAMVPGTNVADVRLVQFSSGSARALRGALTEAIEAGATGLVLDLRGNPGGLVSEATAVAGAFLASGTAYRQQGRDGETLDIPVRGRTPAPDLPLAVLVDFGSASSAEIVAAALRDNGRATLVGKPTFGTGTVLGSYDLSDGSALRLAVVRWLTPKGETIFRVGIAPDVVVALSSGAVALEPSDLLGLTTDEFSRSGDAQLRRGVDVVLDAAARGPDGLGGRARPTQL